MNLENKIKLDIRKSMMGGHKSRTTLLRTVVGEIDRNKDKNLSDDKVISIIKKMKENAELVNNTEEIDILNEYLPKILSEAETNEIVNDMFKENIYTDKDMGPFMKAIKIKYGQSIDMKIVSTKFKELM